MLSYSKIDETDDKCYRRSGKHALFGGERVESFLQRGMKLSNTVIPHVVLSLEVGLFSVGIFGERLRWFLSEIIIDGAEYSFGNKHSSIPIILQVVVN